MSNLTGEQRVRQLNLKTEIMHRRAMRRFMSGEDQILYGRGEVYRENLIKEIERLSSPSVGDRTLQFSQEEAKLIIQWYDSIDLKEACIGANDHMLVRRIYKFLDMRVSNAMKAAASSVSNG